ncbi:MAG TPA: PilZ domain-containing protein [Terriglobales bacterium]|nr:PilZ domain-containing protein [Terriglobales bacterium]
MDRRRQPRVAAFIPVRLWGMDANSLPFTQMGTVKNISSSGVEIHGLTRQVLPGELLDVQLGEGRAEYRVVWAGKMGSRKAGEIGLERLDAEPFIWNLDLFRCSEVAAQG